MGEKENASFNLSDPRVVFVAKVAPHTKSPQVRNANCGRNQCNRTYPIKRKAPEFSPLAWPRTEILLAA